MARLYSDLLSSGGNRYYFGLNSAPGGIGAGVGSIRVVGLEPTIFQQIQVFRNPATATLTLFGYSTAAEPHLQPATAALSLAGQIPGKQLSTVIIPTLTVDYTDLADNPPTLITIMTVTPTTAALTIQALTLNLSQGGNIVIVTPGVGLAAFSPIPPNLPRTIGVGTLTISGLGPTLHTTLVITPEVGLLSSGGQTVRLATPFVWIDDSPVSPSIWIDDPRA